MNKVYKINEAHHIVRTEAELNEILEYENAEYVREVHPQDSGFYNLYPSFSRVKIFEDAVGKYYVKDTKTNYKSKKFICRIKAVNHLLEYERGLAV